MRGQLLAHSHQADPVHLKHDHDDHDDGDLDDGDLDDHDDGDLDDHDGVDDHADHENGKTHKTSLLVSDSWLLTRMRQ